jgi:hypothetical protein
MSLPNPELFCHTVGGILCKISFSDMELYDSGYLRHEIRSDVGIRWAEERKVGHLGMNESDSPDWITNYTAGKLGSQQAKPNTP